MFREDADFQIALYFKNENGDKVNISGHITVGWAGREHKLSSKLKEETSKHYIHELRLISNAEVKHAIDTVYTVLVPMGHALSCTIRLQNLKALRVYGSVGLNMIAPHALGGIQYGTDLYELSAKANLSINCDGQVMVEVNHPNRRLHLRLQSLRADHQYDGSIEAAWDVDRDERKKIALTVFILDKFSWKTQDLVADLFFTTPFKNCEKFAVTGKFQNDLTQSNILGKMTWGDSETFMTRIFWHKPMNLKNIVWTFEIETPFNKLGKASAHIYHTWNGEVNTIVKGTLDKEHAKLSMEGKGDFENLSGNASFASTIQNAEDMSISVSHASSSKNIKSMVKVSHFGVSYCVKLQGYYVRNGWHIKSTGNLTFIVPTGSFSTYLEHENTKRQIQSKFEANYNIEKYIENIGVYLSGSHQSSSVEILQGEFEMKHYVKSNVMLSSTHRQGGQMIDSKAEFSETGNTKVLCNVKVSKSETNAGLGFTLKSSFNEDMKGKINAEYGNYPMTAVGEFQWHPHKEFTAETVFNTEQWDDASAEIILATPINGYRNINLRASNRMIRGETVVQASLSKEAIDIIDLETWYAFTDQIRLVRVQCSSPFTQVNFLNTGVQFEGQVTDFSIRADFELEPYVEKLQGSVKLQYDEDVHGILRLDMPYPECPYLELSVSDIFKGRTRKSRIEAMFQPQQIYSADATTVLDMPFLLEVHLNTPHPEYDNLRLFLKYEESHSSVITHSVLRYHPDKVIKGDLNIDKTLKFESSMALRLVCFGHEEIKLVLQHQGDIRDFSSHGEILFKEKGISADASFNTGYHTRGEFVMSSPFQDMENVRINILKRGPARNLEGEAKILINDEKTEITYRQRLSKRLLKGSLRLTSPYTQVTKMSVAHRIMRNRFTDRISASYGRKFINSQVSIRSTNLNVQSSGTFKYHLGQGRNKARFKITKKGRLNNMNFKADGTLNRDKFKINGHYKYMDDLEANVLLSTPFHNFKTTGLTFSHSGKMKSFKTSSKITYMDNKNIYVFIDFNTDLPKMVHLDSKINTPFEIAPTTSVVFNHGYDNYKGTIKGDISLVASVAHFGSGHLVYEKKNCLGELMIALKAERNRNKVALFNLTHMTASEEMHSSLCFELPKYLDITLGFDHLGDLRSFHSKATGKLDSDRFYSQISKKGLIQDTSIVATTSYNDDAVTVTGLWNTVRNLHCSLEVTTPFEGYESTILEANLETFTGNASFVTTKTNIGLVDTFLSKSGRLDTINNSGDKKSKIEISGYYEIKPHHLLAEIKSPFCGHRNMKFEATVLDSYPKRAITEIHLEYDRVKIFAIETTIWANHKTGFRLIIMMPTKKYKKLEASVAYTNKWPILELRSKASAGLEKQYSFESSFNASTGVFASANIRTPIEGFKNIGANLSAIETVDPWAYEYECRIVYMSGKDIWGKIEIRPEYFRGLDATAELHMPFKNIEKTKLEVRIDDFDLPRKYRFQFSNMDGSLANGKLKIFSIYNLDGSLEMFIPIEAIKHAKADYHYRFDYEQCEGSIVLTYGDRNTISGEMRATYERDFDASINLETPFEGFESMHGSLSFERGHNNHDITCTTSLSIDHDEILSIISFLGLIGEQFSVSTQISTPYSDYSIIELEVTHEGSMDDFQCTGFLSSPIIDDINTMVRVRYNTVSDMDVFASITSSLEQMDDLSAELKTCYIGGEHKVRTVIGWTSGQQVRRNFSYPFY